MVSAMRPARSHGPARYWTQFRGSLHSPGATLEGGNLVVHCEYCYSAFVTMGEPNAPLREKMERECFLCAFCSTAYPIDIFSGEYSAYLQSPRWKSLRRAALKRAENRCQVCNSDLLLQVHHRKYPEELGLEDPMDLTVLCRRCHDLFHTVKRG